MRAGDDGEQSASEPAGIVRPLARSHAVRREVAEVVVVEHQAQVADVAVGSVRERREHELQLVNPRVGDVTWQRAYPGRPVRAAVEHGDLAFRGVRRLRDDLLRALVHGPDREPRGTLRRALLHAQDEVDVHGAVRASARARRDERLHRMREPARPGDGRRPGELPVVRAPACRVRELAVGLAHRAEASGVPRLPTVGVKRLHQAAKRLLDFIVGRVGRQPERLVGVHEPG